MLSDFVDSLFQKMLGKTNTVIPMSFDHIY